MSVPAIAGVSRLRDGQRSSAALVEGSSLLDQPLARAAEIADLPIGEARAKFHAARDGASDEQLSRRARALAQVCDAIDALRRAEYATATQAADGAIRLSPEEPLALLVHAASAAGRGDRGAAERSIERLQAMRNASPTIRARAAYLRAESNT